MALKITRNNGETWEECAGRYAKEYGLENEAMSSYWYYFHRGFEPSQAAYYALSDWDCLDYEDE